MQSVGLSSIHSSRNVLPYSAGDSSHVLSSFKSGGESLSAGSAVTADSFVNVAPMDEDDSRLSYDPYLESAQRKLNFRNSRQNKSQGPESSQTPVTTPLDDSSEDSHYKLPTDVPNVLEIPVKVFKQCMSAAFETRQWREGISEVQLRRIHERNYWNKIVSDRIEHFGTIHLRVGEGLLLLGNAHMSCKEYMEALRVFKSAVRIFRRLKGDSHLSVAKALDKVGQAASHLNTEENTRIALVALNEAFEVRYEILGPTHADTVDSLNNIAAVHLNMRDYHLARKAYHEVYIVRQLIFGPRHPSVAITAHQLGGVHLALSQVEDAARYYQRALEIYQKLKLRSDNPTMKRLSRDIAELERLGGIVGAQC